MAISGASGPSTAPRLSVAKAAIDDARQLDRRNRPDDLNPSAGE